MKFTIESDDEQEHRSYLAGPRLAAAITEFSEALRQKDKYGTEDATTWSAVRSLLSDYCGDVMEEIER